MSQEFNKSHLPRRSVYHLNKQVNISNQAITDIVRFHVENTPSAFNSQTTRAVVVFGDKSSKIWNDITYNILKEKMAAKPEAFEAQTGPKLNMFGAGYATILWFEDDEKIEELKKQFPSYAAKFPEWAAHSGGAAQINTWAALALEGLGGNLQHYSPLIDEAIAKEFNVPETWRLVAQLVIGGIVEHPSKPEHLDPRKTVLVVE